jgi:hypothetical protein
MDLRRRQFLTSPGETLLLPLQAWTIAERLKLTRDYTNLPKESLVSSPLVVVPIPKRPAGQQWPVDTEPAAFWHPLLWLPERLREPQADEPTDVWAVRVALELTVTGLYDMETGTWLDVLSTVGLDSEDPVVQARITEWLEGEPDPDLDRIDLTAGMTSPDGELEWSREEAESLLALLVPASWAVLSNDLITMASEALADENITNESLASDAQTITLLAIGSIGEGPSAVEGEEKPSSLWDRIEADLVNWPGRTLETNKAGPFDALVESLYAIRNDYWVFVEALWENGTADASAAPAEGEPQAIAA